MKKVSSHNFDLTALTMNVNIIQPVCLMSGECLSMFSQERKLFLREAVLTRIVNKAFLCGEVYICQDQILLTETNSEPETEVRLSTGSGGSFTPRSSSQVLSGPPTLSPLYQEAGMSSHRLRPSVR